MEDVGWLTGITKACGVGEEVSNAMSYSAVI